MSMLSGVMEGGALSFGEHEVEVIDQMTRSRQPGKVQVLKVEFNHDVPQRWTSGNKFTRGMSVTLYLSYRARKTTYTYYVFPETPTNERDPNWTMLRTRGWMSITPQFFNTGKRMQVTAQLKPEAFRQLQVLLDQWEEEYAGVFSSPVQNPNYVNRPTARSLP